MSKPAVSIILTQKNCEEYPSAALECLRVQTFSDHETVIAAPLESLAISRNRAAKKSQAEYLAFVDSDQLWTPAKLQKQVARLKENLELSWCYCDAFFSDGKTRASENAPLHAGDILRPLLLKNFIPSGSVIVRRSVFDALGGFDECDAHRLSEEWDLWLRIAAAHPVGLIAEPLLQLPSEVPASEQHQLSRKRVVESAVARHQDRLKDLRSESLAEICIAAGKAQLRANRRDEARVHFAEALTHSPLRSDAYVSWVSSFLSSQAQQQILALHNLSDLHNLSRQLQETSKPTEKIES